MDGVFRFCCTRLRIEADQFRHLIRSDDRSVHSLFRYALARELAPLIREMEPAVTGVYVIGSAAGPRAGPESDLDLIVRVDGSKEQVVRRMTALDEQVTAFYRDLLGRGAKECWRLLDFKVVDESEVRNRFGWAAAVNSLHNPPLAV